MRRAQLDPFIFRYLFRMKKIHIEESMGILSTKMSEVNVKERSLLTQLREAKDHLISKVRLLNQIPLRGGGK